jgi:hypothetical protein
MERIKIFQSKSKVTKVEYISTVAWYMITVSGIVKCTNKLPQRFKEFGGFILRLFSLFI